MAPSIRHSCALWLAAALALAPGAGAQQPRSTVHAGMSEAEAVAVLGAPPVVRRVGEWSYLFYPNGCPVVCGKDDVVFVRGCRVVTAILLRADRAYAGPPPRQAFAAPPPAACSESAVSTASPGRSASPAVSSGTVAAAELSTAAPAPASPSTAETPTETTAEPAASTGSSSPAPHASPASRETPAGPAGATAAGDGSAAAMPAARAVPVRQDTAPDRRRLAAFRDSLSLPRARSIVQALPAGSISSPTAFGLDQGEAFVGAGFQARTRYTDLSDAAAVAGFGLGNRGRYVGLEVAFTSYSTIRGDGPLETGGVSFKLHRALGERTGIAAGVENAVDWGDPDGGTSVFAAATRVFQLRPDSAGWLTAVVATVGAGNGRFRSEDDVADERETVNVFGSVGVRLAPPVAVVADWTGQDLNLAASLTPLRRLPLVLNAGLADVTGSAGDGARFIFSFGYGFLLRSPF